MARDQIATRPVRAIVVAGEDAADLTPPVERHVEDEVHPGQLADAEPVLMERIPIEHAVRHPRMVDHAVGVHELHGLEARDARQDGLAPPEKPA